MVEIELICLKGQGDKAINCNGPPMGAKTSFWKPHVFVIYYYNIMVGESMFPWEILKSDVQEKRPNPDSTGGGGGYIHH